MAKNEGMTAAAALRELRPQEEATESETKLAGGITWVDREYDERNGHPGRRDLMEALIAGEWHARGYKVPAGQSAELVPVDHWDFLTLDVDADSAEGGGIAYVRLRFFRTSSSTADKAAGRRGKKRGKYYPELKKILRATPDIGSMSQKELHERIGKRLASVGLKCPRRTGLQSAIDAALDEIHREEARR